MYASQDRVLGWPRPAAIVMKLSNESPYPAYLFRTGIDEHRIFASVVVRVTHDIVDGRLRPAAAQRWTVSASEWVGPHGPMPGDHIPYRSGVDVLVFGSARAHGGRPVPCIEVGVEIGARWRSRVVAFGDRTWRRGVTGLVPSDPDPVREVPLTLARAYGGCDEWDGLQVPFVDNPAGRGFYLESSRAHGKLLPNLEDPDDLIRAWDDRPEPVGTTPCAQTFGPRVRRGLELDEDQQTITRIDPRFFNDAFPGMVAPVVAPGDTVVVRGVREDGPLTFTLPEPPVRVDIRVGDDGGVRTPAIDQIGVDADARSVYLSYRFPFRYVLIPHRLRHCRLLAASN